MTTRGQFIQNVRGPLYPAARAATDEWFPQNWWNSMVCTYVYMCIDGWCLASPSTPFLQLSRRTFPSSFLFHTFFFLSCGMPFAFAVHQPPFLFALYCNALLASETTRAEYIRQNCPVRQKSVRTPVANVCWCNTNMDVYDYTRWLCSTWTGIWRARGEVVGGGLDNSCKYAMHNQKCEEHVSLRCICRNSKKRLVW